MRVLGCSGLLVALTACDPGWAATGRVDTVAPGAAAPIALKGATVSIECPEIEAVAATTNAQGEFSVSELGFLDDACEVVVSYPGFATQRVSVDEACGHRWRVGGRRCHYLEVEVVLDPSS